MVYGMLQLKAGLLQCVYKDKTTQQL